MSICAITVIPDRIVCGVSITMDLVHFILPLRVESILITGRDRVK